MFLIFLSLTVDPPQVGMAMSMHSLVAGEAQLEARPNRLDPPWLGGCNLLKITVEEQGTKVRLVLEGRLEQPLVSELERAFTQQRVIAGEKPLIIDLCGLTGIDQAGESTLQNLYRRGATLHCADLMNQYLVERITQGGVKPLQAPCRPYHSNGEQTIHREDK